MQIASSDFSSLRSKEPFSLFHISRDALRLDATVLCIKHVWREASHKQLSVVFATSSIPNSIAIKNTLKSEHVPWINNNQIYALSAAEEWPMQPGVALTTHQLLYKRIVTLKKSPPKRF